MQRTKNIFDKIGSLIPGYRGYAERDGRRNCDIGISRHNRHLVRANLIDVAQGHARDLLHAGGCWPAVQPQRGDHIL